MNASGEVKSTKGSSGPWNKEKPVTGVRVPKSLQDAPPHVRSQLPQLPSQMLPERPQLRNNIYMQQQPPTALFERNDDLLSQQQMPSQILPERPQLRNNLYLQQQPSPARVDRNEEVLSQSTLNANAVEFVPKWLQAPPVHPITSEDEAYLMEAFEILTLSPGRYQEFLPPIEDIFESYLHDYKATSHILDIILEQCIVESNLRYTGARLCRALSHKFGLNLINCLLERCKEKNSQLSILMVEDRARVSGFALLLAELFQQVTIENDHIKAIAMGLRHILEMLISTPYPDTIKTACQILKLCGMTLERGSGIDLQSIFSCLEKMCQHPNLEENICRLIMNVIQIRRSEWNSKPYSPAEPPPALPHPSAISNEPVFYGPDGEILSEEESSFLRENIPVSEDLDDYVLDTDNMDDEACAAYEDFLNYSAGFRK